MESKGFTSGVVVFVEGDDKNTWYFAKQWQREKFFKMMRFGTTKSMGYPNPHEESEPFKGPFGMYKIHVHNDWGPVYLENLNTKRKREIRYIELPGNPAAQPRPPYAPTLAKPLI